MVAEVAVAEADSAEVGEAEVVMVAASEEVDCSSNPTISKLSYVDIFVCEGRTQPNILRQLSHIP